MTIKDDSSSIISPVDTLRMLAQMAFKCQRCGWCCTSCDPITVNAADVVAISSYLNKPLHVVSRKYTHIHKTTHKPSIKKTKPCSFYDVITKTCKIYPVRPLVCRSWPFMSGEDGVNDEQVAVYPECPGAVQTYQTLEYIQEKFRKEFEDHPERLEQIRQNVDPQKITDEIVKLARNKLLK